MLKYIVAFVALFSVADYAFAIGTTIATYLALEGFAYVATAFAINMVASAVITKAFFTPNQPSMDLASSAENPGNRQQTPPATDNKLPIVYGSAWLGGTIIDLSITSDNQQLFYVLALSEVTNNGSDNISFGDCYWGGKKVFFKANGYEVAYLLDESTGISDTTVEGKIKFYFYKNGSYEPTNSNFSAIDIMSNSGLTYKWDSTKQMTNCAFVIINLTYSQSANIRGIEQTKFQVINKTTKPGDVILDYLLSETYGAGLKSSQINYNSLNDLNTYSNELVPYTNNSGGTSYLPRFKFDGVIDTNNSIMKNLQDMVSCCDALLQYNEITAQWGVITQKSSYTIAMNLNDSNLIGSLSISPLDLAGTYNIIECKFPDERNQDSFNTAVFDLAQIDPTLMFPNEPINKQSVSLPLINNNVRAQIIASRMLKSAREDLQVSCKVNFQGIQLEAGDIVTLSSINYGWVNKLFRVNKVTEQFEDSGVIVATLLLSEFNPDVYSNVSVTDFEPSPNTGIGDPTFFGAVPAPVLNTQYTNAIVPLFLFDVYASSSGIIQYAEIWYSAYQNPTPSQLIFAGTTAIKSDGSPYNPNELMDTVTLSNIPSGNWYFFSRMANNLATSEYSPASSIFIWRPTTTQYQEQYLAVVYGDDENGANLSLNPTNKIYYGLRNQNNTVISTIPSDYKWFLADPNFGTNKYLCFINRENRKFSFSVGFADYAAGSGAFVPTQANLFDPSIWSSLPNGINFIDLDIRTGQLIQTGTTTVGTGEIAISNSPDGKVVASLQKFLDFGAGVYTYTGSAATLTIDIYGRVVGFTTPDNFYFTKEAFVAIAGQTVFTPSARNAGYITGQDLVFKNGILLKPTDDYTETSTSVTLNISAELNDVIEIVSFRSVDGSITYPSFTRNYVSLTNASSYTASGFTITSGFEFLFINGIALSDVDYDVIGQTITNFPNTLTGEMLILQWSPNNLGVPNGTPVNQTQPTQIGVNTYSFGLDSNAFNLYYNGVLLKQSTDYTTSVNEYTLSQVPTTINSSLIQQTFARAGAA